ncbi:hypothetical protein SCHPADRAFT_902917 [Schizopora paradoxa]|uniref:Uncharacterized protein n=1 Tax=Schizopora paradoxa TaxID=27342 RepID=A0A0H2RSI8_9AGAM|nr:hypothetical protein SCHPADRAFT_902917 [Schizopora paradoxa]
MKPPPVHGDPYLCSLWIPIAPQAPPARPPGYHADPQVDVALTAGTDSCEVWKYIFVRPGTLQYIGRFSEDYLDWRGPVPDVLQPAISPTDQSPQAPRMRMLGYEYEHRQFTSLF